MEILQSAPGLIKIDVDLNLAGIFQKSIFGQKVISAGIGLKSLFDWFRGALFQTSISEDTLNLTSARLATLSQSSEEISKTMTEEVFFHEDFKVWQDIWERQNFTEFRGIELLNESFEKKWRKFKMVREVRL